MLVPHHHFFNKTTLGMQILSEVDCDAIWLLFAKISSSTSVKPRLRLFSLIWRPPVCPHEVIPSLMWSCLGLPFVSRSSTARFDHSFALRWGNSVYAVLSATILLTAGLLFLPRVSSLTRDVCLAPLTGKTWPWTLWLIYPTEPDPPSLHLCLSPPVYDFHRTDNPMWENELGLGGGGGTTCVTFVFTGGHEIVFTRGKRKTYMSTDQWNFHVL